MSLYSIISSFQKNPFDQRAAWLPIFLLDILAAVKTLISRFNSFSVQIFTKPSRAGRPRVEGRIVAQDEVVFDEGLSF
jgi:hypothetical protein